MKIVLSASLILAGAFHVFAASTNLVPVADTMIMAIAPSNNAGALAWFTAGGNHFGDPSRALLRFDIAGAIPTGSRVTSASLLITVTKVPGDGYTVAYFDLHRLLRTWGEGTNNPVSAPGQGTPATVNEATWTNPLALTTNVWNAPGAAAGSDYVPVTTASQIVYTEVQSPYIFPDPNDDPAPMIADVQLWLNHPETNFGWIFICEDETSPNTTRRFGSREDPGNAPLLQLTYVAAPRINVTGVTGNAFQLSFDAQPDQTYAVEFSPSLRTPNWQTLTNLASPSNEMQLILSVPIISTQSFYRIVTH